MFASIRSLAVYVQDTDRARDFYTQVLGFEVESEVSPDLYILRSPNRRILLRLEGGKNRAFTDRDSCRVGFTLESEEQAEALYDRLLEARVQLLQDRPEQVDGSTACFQVLDPDGNIVEVCGKL